MSNVLLAILTELHSSTIILCPAKPKEVNFSLLLNNSNIHSANCSEVFRFYKYTMIIIFYCRRYTVGISTNNRFFECKPL